MTPSPTTTTNPTPSGADTKWCALVVDDDAGIRQSLRLCLEPMGGRVLGVGSAGAAFEALERSPYDVVLLDLWLGSKSGLDVLPEILKRQPSAGVIVITAFATFETAVEAMKRGASDYMPKPFTPDQVRVAVERVLANQRLKARVSELETALAGSDVAPWFDSHSTSYNAFLVAVRKAAASDAIVLLSGESGTGKNVLAQRIRAQSTRRDRPFVTVDCPALPEDQMSSALFGYARGAFATASEDTPGKVQDAEGGTLFLDDVAALSLDAQGRLLRLLAEKTYERLGDRKDRHADVRIVAATNRSLDDLVRDGRFRDDLLFRLRVVSLTVPPLRDRSEDILPLARHFLSFFASRHGRPNLTFSDAAARALSAQRWPGNLRELRNCIERAAILAPADTLTPFDLGLTAEETVTGPVHIGSLVSLEELEKEHIARVIAKTPTLDAAAKILGIDATTLQRRRKRFGLA